MKQLSRTDVSELQDLHEEIRDLLQDCEKVRAEAAADLEKLVTELNEKRQRAWEIVDQAATEADGYFDERSEKWQESDKGQNYAEWRDELQRVAGEIEEEFETPELPEIEEPGWVGEIADTPWSEVSE